MVPKLPFAAQFGAAFVVILLNVCLSGAGFFQFLSANSASQSPPIFPRSDITSWEDVMDVRVRQQQHANWDAILPSVMRFFWPASSENKCRNGSCSPSMGKSPSMSVKGPSTRRLEEIDEEDLASNQDDFIPVDRLDEPADEAVDEIVRDVVDDSGFDGTIPAPPEEVIDLDLDEIDRQRRYEQHRLRKLRHEQKRFRHRLYKMRLRYQQLDQMGELTHLEQREREKLGDLIESGMLSMRHQHTLHKRHRLERLRRLQKMRKERLARKHEGESRPVAEEHKHVERGRSDGMKQARVTPAIRRSAHSDSGVVHRKSSTHPPTETKEKVDFTVLPDQFDVGRPSAAHKLDHGRPYPDSNLHLNHAPIQTPRAHASAAPKHEAPPAAVGDPTDWSHHPETLEEHEELVRHWHSHDQQTTEQLALVHKWHTHDLDPSDPSDASGHQSAPAPAAAASVSAVAHFAHDRAQPRLLAHHALASPAFMPVLELTGVSGLETAREVMLPTWCMCKQDAPSGATCYEYTVQGLDFCVGRACAQEWSCTKERTGRHCRLGQETETIVPVNGNECETEKGVRYVYVPVGEGNGEGVETGAHKAV